MTTLTPKAMVRQTNKAKQSFKKYAVFAIMTVVFLGCLWLIFAPSKKDREAEKEGTGFNSDIPDPRGAGIVGDKKTAYEQEQQRLRRQEKMHSLEDYSYMLGRQDETEEERIAREERELRMAPKPVEYYENPELFEQNSPSRAAARSGYYQTSGAAYRDLNASLGNFFEEPKTDPEKEEMQAEIEKLKTIIAEQENRSSAYDDPLVLLEKSFEMATRYNNGPPSEQEVSAVETSSGRKTKVEPVTQVQTQVVSALPRGMSDAEFIGQFGQVRNYGFNTVSGETEQKGKNTIGAVVHGDQTLVDGQTVRLRITEALRAGRYLVPRNTIITGVGRIADERLEISVTSIECEGNIIPVELAVYDSDGRQGIHIPGSMEIEAFKEIAGNLGQGLGTTINLNQQSAGEQLLTDLGRGAIQGTSQYIAKKARQVKVTLKAGYRLMLLPGENL